MEVRAYANENRIIVMEDFLKQKLESDLVRFKVKLAQVSLRFPKHTAQISVMEFSSFKFFYFYFALSLFS